MFNYKKNCYIFADIGDKVLEEEKPNFLQNLIFKYLKKNPEKKIAVDIDLLSKKLISNFENFSDKKCLSFFLNDEKSHDDFLKKILTIDCDRYIVFPFFPQYCLESHLIANFFSINLPESFIKRFFWIKSYNHNPLFIKSIQKNIQLVFNKDKLNEKECKFLFLADAASIKNPLYLLETEITCQNIIKCFPYTEGHLCYSPEKFLKDFKDLKSWKEKNIIIIPISTLIDDNKILKKIELLKGFLKEKTLQVLTCKTLNHSDFFIRSIFDIIDEKNYVLNDMLITF